MILYAELAAWVARAALFSFLLTGMTANIILYATGGIVRGFWGKYFLVIVISLSVNLILFGLPKLRAAKKPSDLVLLDSFAIGSISTLNFLLQGTRMRVVTRNIAFLPGLKSVSRTADGLGLFIENIGSPNRNSYFVTLGILLLVLIAFFAAPGLMLLVFYLIDNVLRLFNFPVNFAGDLIKYFSLTILMYLLIPYVSTYSKYLKNSLRFFAKHITSRYGYSVYTSPLIPYIEPRKIFVGLADPQGRNFVNPDYVKNNETIFNYVVAHEAGHLSGKYDRVTHKMIAPLLFPITVFVLLAAGSYLKGIGYITFGNTLALIGLITPWLAIYFWFDLSIEWEERADDYAVQKIGPKPVIKALEELVLKSRTLEGAYSEIASKLSGGVPYYKRLERIRNKWDVM